MTHTFREQAPIKPKRASSQAASQRSLPLKQSLSPGIKVTSTVTTKTVKAASCQSPLRNRTGYKGYEAGHD